MSRSRSSPLHAVLRSAVAALLVTLLDALVARQHPGTGAFELALQLRAMGEAAVLLFALHLVATILLAVPCAMLKGDAVALGRALGFGLAGFVLDVGLVRWDAARADSWALAQSLLNAAAVTAIAYPLVLRIGRALGGSRGASVGFSRKGERPGALAWVAALLLAAIVAAPYALPSAEADPDDGRVARPTSREHRVPRVLLIVVDTLRADALSCSSTDAPPTPVIDALADEGYRFTEVRTPGAWTLPSVASILTGVSPLVHGAIERTSTLPAALPTLATAMADAGYRTAAIGHNYVLSPTRQLHRDFDHYDFGARRGQPPHSLGFLLLARQDTTPRGDDIEADDINARAFEWLDEHADEDFFLWLHYYDPHLVYEPPIDLRPTRSPPAGYDYSYGHEALGRVRSGYEVPNVDQREWIKELYDAEVRYLDRELGNLFAKLKSLDLYDDTLIVLTSDHGEEFWEHEGFEHGHTLYDEVLRVPLIVKPPLSLRPTADAARVLDTPASLENVYPTILALCDLPIDGARVTATPLLATDGTPTSDVAPPMASTGNLYYQNRVAVITDGWKYIRFLETGSEELYDLANDPAERISRIATEPERLAAGRAHCDRVLEAARVLREANGISSSNTELDAETLQRMQDIGYMSKE